LQIKAKQTILGFQGYSFAKSSPESAKYFQFVIWKKHVESSLVVHKAPTGFICTRLDKKKFQSKISCLDLDRF